MIKSATKRKKRKTTTRKQKKSQDERIPKLLGAFLVLVALYLTIAFISYIFTWKTDQDKVLRFSWSLITQSDLSVSNWLGRLGAVLSNTFFYWGFGISSFAFIYVIGRTGLLILARKSLSKIISQLKYIMIGVVFTSLLLEFIFWKSAFSWGGAFGESTAFWLSNFLGTAGLLLFLMFSFGGFLIWIFNPNFNIQTPAFQNSRFLNFFTSMLALETSQSTAQKPKNDISFDFDDDFGDQPEKSNNESDKESTTLKPNFLSRFSFKKKGTSTENAESGKAEGIQLESSKAENEESKTSKPKPDLEYDLPEKERLIDKADPDSIADLEIELQQNVEITEGKPVVETPIPDIANPITQNDPTHSAPYDPKLDLSSYEYPSIELLNEYSDQKVEIDRSELEANKDQIIETLLNYKIEITKIRATIGPTVTLYEIVPAAGVRISKIKNLEDDIALSLAALGIRIIAPIPGKGTIGIEVPNKKKQIVSLKETLRSEKFQNAKMDLPIALGKTINNEVFVGDLAKMPHLLIAGATGQGKSVGINTIIMSLLYKKHPSQLKLVLIDPKKVELFPYSKLVKHYLAFLPNQEEPIVTETKRVIYTLNSLCIEMDQRYDLLKKGRARNIKEYNEKFVSRKLNPNNGHRFLPFIVLIVDEFADLIMTAGKEVELPIGRLAQLARAVGIHLIIATQRPSVNIITGVIKANFPARLAFKVTSKVDSRTILDTGGADQLIGRGDMLLSTGSNCIRLQGAFVDTPEVEDVLDHIEGQQGYPEPYYLPEYVSDDDPVKGAESISYGELDDLLDDAARLVVSNQHGSTSMIQRRMKLGYNRAGRIMDQLEALGIVGENQGSKAREVLFFSEQELELFLEQIKKKK